MPIDTVSTRYPDPFDTAVKRPRAQARSAMPPASTQFGVNL